VRTDDPRLKTWPPWSPTWSPRRRPRWTAPAPSRVRASTRSPARSPGWRGSTRPATSRSGVAHLEHQSALDPTLRGKLRAEVERRHDALVDTAGLPARCGGRAVGAAHAQLHV